LFTFTLENKDIITFKSKSITMRRRDFIKNTSLATAGLTILDFPVFGKNAPGNKVIIAVMGVNSRGAALAEGFSKLQMLKLHISVM